jgi:hypothetical protein
MLLSLKLKILLPPPPKWLILQVCTTMPSVKKNFKILVKYEFTNLFIISNTFLFCFILFF